MPKILSQAGISLADTYDVKGSIAGIDTLETHELPIVHEMGGTIFSERYSTTVRRSRSVGVGQNTDVNTVFTNFPDTPTRVLGVAVICTAGVRIDRWAVHVRDPIALREFPLWVYDGANFLSVNIEDDTPGVVTEELLLGNVQATMLPSFGGGTDQPQIVNEIAIRGRTTGFGAGTVNISTLLYIAFSQIGGISSRGLPIPSW